MDNIIISKIIKNGILYDSVNDFIKYELDFINNDVNKKVCFLSTKKNNGLYNDIKDLRNILAKNKKDYTRIIL